MLVLGIDPGLLKTGWGLVENRNNTLIYIASGVIKNKQDNTLDEKLKNIFINLDEIIKAYKPNAFSIEETFVNNNPLTSLKLGHARGVAMLAGAINDIKVFEYSANKIKKTVTGVGKANKDQIVMMVKILLPKKKEFDTEDEADALAIAICHINQNNFKI